MTAPEPVADSPPARILLLDDDRLGLALTARGLEERGFRVDCFERAEAALEALGSGHFDAVVSDVLMPGMDGYEFCRRVRASPGCAALPVLVLTALDDEEATRRACEAGATDFCVKSLNWTLLAHRIGQMLRVDRLTRAPATGGFDPAGTRTPSPGAGFAWRSAEHRVACTPGLRRMLGLADGGDWEHERRLLALLRPEDRRALRRSFARMLGGGPAVRLHAALAGAAGGSGGIQVEAQQVRSLAGGAFEVSGVVRHASDASRADSARHRAMRFDAVTGLPNRTWLVERMAALPDRPAAAVAILGIERFAGLADALGPQASDGLAAEIAVRLRRLAASGRPGEASIDAIAQLERDVWCLLLAGPVDRVAATDAVQQALAAMREPFRIAGRELFLRASAGVDLHAQDGDEPMRRLARAARARAVAQASGGERVVVFEPSMAQTGPDRLEIERDLHYALARGEMAMWYQPQVDARAGRVIGFEALMRWNRAGRVQPAGDFIPIAEETGLIVPLGEWAVGESCRALAALHAGGLPDCTLAVNLSCSQLRTGRLPGVIQAALAANGLRGGALEVELTESGMMSDPEVAVAELAAVRALGAGLAVDDFGTGYSSLAYLTRLPLTTLKIDRSFVADIATSEPSRAVARTIVSLAGNLRLRAVAEGVETEAQRDVLLALGCTLQQGWLHGRAMPLSEALDIAGAHAGIAEVSS